jgi:hypothetical protein
VPPGLGVVEALAEPGGLGLVAGLACDKEVWSSTFSPGSRSRAGGAMGRRMRPGSRAGQCGVYSNPFEEASSSGFPAHF